MNIAVITSGGDSPGMNPCIAKLVLEGEKRGHRILGYTGGYPGILAGDPVKLHSGDVYGLFKLGGTILKSGRLPGLTDYEVRRTVLKKLADDSIDALIVMGGDGSMRGAGDLGSMGSAINFIGIPCTIDNNIYGSDYTLGHDTALNKLTQYIDDITDTALSMGKRIFLVVTLGGYDDYFVRDMADIGICDFAITNEHPLTGDEAVNKMEEIFAADTKSFIIVAIAEHYDTTSLIDVIRGRLGIEPKINMIGYQQRGGVPTALERLHAVSFAVYAIKAAESRIINKYVVFSGGKYEYLDLALVGKSKEFRPWIEQMERKNYG